jgi:dTDP-L-rhamnose 4-epimerase
VYAATKLHQEHLCFVFGREMSVPVAALRYHNVYGPRMPLDTPYAGVASIFKSAFESGIAPRVFEDGEQRRDFVHVRDVAKANVICCLRDEPASGVFNIASGEVRTVLDLAEALRAGYGEEAKSPIVTGDYRLGDVRHIFAANERAARDLGFRSSVSFSTGMAEFAMVTTNSLPHDAIMTTETVKLPKK